MFMFVGGEVKHMAFAVGGAILFSGTYSIDFNFIFVKQCMPHLFMVSLGDFMIDAANQNFKIRFISFMLDATNQNFKIKLMQQ